MKKHLLITSLAAALFLGSGCVRSDSSVPQAGESASDTDRASGARLDLHGRGLVSVPKDVFERTELVELDLSGNRLSGALPAEIRHLRALRVLEASDNRMTGLPAEIGQLKELRRLDLSGNRLTGLPHELGQLSKLEELDLSGNDVSVSDLDVIRSQIPGARISL